MLYSSEVTPSSVFSQKETLQLHVFIRNCSFTEKLDHQNAPNISCPEENLWPWWIKAMQKPSCLLLAHKEANLILKNEPQFSIFQCPPFTVFSHILQVLFYLACTEQTTTWIPISGKYQNCQARKFLICLVCVSLPSSPLYWMF